MNRVLSVGRWSVRSLLAAAFVAASGSASAAVITVTNPGFAATVNQNFTYNAVNYFVGNDIPVGLYTNTLDGSSTGIVRKQSDDQAVKDGSNNDVTATVTGWLAPNPRAGVANFSGLGEVGNLVTLGTPSGLNVRFTQVLPGSIQLLANTTYTLSIDLRRLTFGIPPTFTAVLTVGGTPVVGGDLDYSPPPNDATAGSAVFTYTTNASPLSGNLGILISATDTSGTLTRILIDNVSLTSEALPEPASIGLLAMSGLELLRRRRRTNRSDHAAINFRTE